MISRDFAWHPYLFAIYSVLYLYAANAHQAALSDNLLPILFVLVFVALLTNGLNLVVRERCKSSLIATASLIWFFSWGHILKFGSSRFLGDADPLNLKYNLNLILLASVSIGLISFFLIRLKKSPVQLTKLVNMITLMLVLLQVYTATSVLLARDSVATRPGDINVMASPDLELPNIYYIIVDGYARSDILSDLFAYDNRSFIAHLRQRGFYVAEKSNANYSQTLLSLVSTMNMNLIDPLITLDRTSNDRLIIKSLLGSNQVLRILRANGYQLAVFESGYDMVDFDQIDISLSHTWYQLSEFSSRLIETTPIPFFSTSFSSPYAEARDRIEYIFTTLPRINQLESPYFVFAHILSPHPPFLYDSTGAAREPSASFTLSDGSHWLEQVGTRAEYLDGYTQQIKYMTGRLTVLIDEILEANKDNPPLIFLQADHGSGSQLEWVSVEKTNVRERMGILNAYYFPGMSDSSALYESITPVNSFRVMLNLYFGAELSMIADRSFFSTWDSPFLFEEVTDRVDSAQR